MKAMKKLFAFALAAIMVMAMGITVFAEEEIADPTIATEPTATITINGAGQGAKFYAIQIIEPDPTTETGWTIINDIFLSVLVDNQEDVDEQDVIKALINKKASEEGETDLPYSDETLNIDDKQYEIALNAAISKSIWNQEGEFANETEYNPLVDQIVVDSAGVYAVMGYEEGYSYKVAAGYVSFGYDDNGQLDGLEDVEIGAKKEPVDQKDIKSIEEDDDHVVEIGREIEYTVEANVPYFAAIESDREYIFTDTISGAVFGDSVVVTCMDQTWNLTIAAAYANDDANATAGSLLVNENADGSQTITIDLKALLGDNFDAYANQLITIKYSAIVTDYQVDNNAVLQDPTTNSEFGIGSVSAYTGAIELTKYGDNTGLKEKLAGAGFKVSKNVGEGDTTETEYAIFEKVDDGGYYLLSEWTKNIEEATEVFTNEEGYVQVAGMDLGTYYLTETTAPEGYSINTAPVEAKIELSEKDENDVATGVQVVATSMTDTKLSALPSTGGIGTTIFTICGVCVMVGAASLFFVSRRRNAR